MWLYFCYLTSSVLNICVITDQRADQVKKHEGEDSLICGSVSFPSFSNQGALIWILKTRKVQKEKLGERSKVKHEAIWQYLPDTSCRMTE